MLNSTLKRAKSSQYVPDVDVHLFHEATDNGRGRCLQPDRVDIIDCQAIATGRQQNLRISTVSATDRLHSRAACSRRAQ
jgi:hypothetical protein